MATGLFGPVRVIMEGTIAPKNSCARPGLEKKARPQEQLNCPRCNSTNTKFCYYNNYSLTQPRYFCKTCRRYWTEGGSLRNVPVGGGSRKNKKVITSSSASKVPDLNPSPTLSSPSAIISSQQNPKIQQGGQYLNLAFPVAMEQYHHHGMSPFENNGDTISTSSAAPTSLSALELLRSGMASGGLNPNYVPNSLMPNSNNAIYPISGFPMQEIKPNNLGFSVDGLGNRALDGGVQHNTSGRLVFPFGDIKQLSAGTAEMEHNNNKEQGNSSTGYWTGMIGEGTW